MDYIQKLKSENSDLRRVHHLKSEKVAGFLQLWPPFAEILGHWLFVDRASKVGQRKVNVALRLSSSTFVHFAQYLPQIKEARRPLLEQLQDLVQRDAEDELIRPVVSQLAEMYVLLSLASTAYFFFFADVYKLVR